MTTCVHERFCMMIVFYAADTVYEDAGKYQSLSYYAETLK
jgi:hypothetical protein